MVCKLIAQRSFASVLLLLLLLLSQIGYLLSWRVCRVDQLETVDLCGILGSRLNVIIARMMAEHAAEWTSSAEPEATSLPCAELLDEPVERTVLWC